MNPPAELPAEIRAGFGAIRRATGDLIAAARTWDYDAIRDALDRRKEAIAVLEPVVIRFRDTAGSAAGELLARETEAIETQAEEAHERLRGVQNLVRDAAGKLIRDGVAIRSYAEESPPGRALDRSR